MNTLKNLYVELAETDQKDTARIAELERKALSYEASLDVNTIREARNLAREELAAKYNMVPWQVRL